ncbi:Na+/H+ antiporter [Archaeoglobus neptunius]|uniref:Na+/H+ antiporter n=1 Tax=Archaeoglobus neptunius TaxID=2798580 RepID=UPI0019284DB6|nr:Na+/H+ antiporter [Archaeoglobus neptunius]
MFVDLNEIVVEFVELLMIAVVVAVAVKFTKFPYTIALVVAGFFVGISGLLPEIPLTRELVFTVILPPLLFEAALNMDLHELRENLKPVSTMAFFGVVVSTLVVGYALHYFCGFPLELALLLGAIVSPTDPVSVLATFKSISAPKRLSAIIEGESVLNDGAAVVVFAIMYEMLKSGSFNLFSGVVDFILVCAGGVIVGAVLGYLAYRILSGIDDHMVEIAITIVLAYSSFLVAENFHVSGVIAAVSAGLIVGNYGRIFSMSPSTRIVLMDFWSVVVFLVNSVVFILIGINTHLNIFYSWKAILVAILAVLLARAAVVYPVMTWLRFPSLWKHTVFWGGLRGVIPVALALSFGNVQVSTITFGVVIFSLTVQGLTLEIFVRKRFRDVKKTELERAIARYIAAKSARYELKRAVEEGKVVEPVAERLMGDLDREIAGARAELQETLKLESGSDIVKRARKYVLNAKKSALREASSRGVVSPDVVDEVLREIDEEIAGLDES